MDPFVSLGCSVGVLSGDPAQHADEIVDTIGIESSRRLQARHPEAEIYAMRIGYDVVYTLGGTVTVQAETVTILTGTAGLDHNLEALEQAISGKAQRLAEMEREAEKHFDRVYRQMARTFTPRRGHHV